MELPVLTEALRPERADAAANRERILEAARRLFAEHGVSCTSMEAIAEAAGVGKGTVFRRFGDRATLAHAVLDGSGRELQDAMLHGPPPLGPGAPARERLIAFGEASLDHLEAHQALILAAEEHSRDGGYLRARPYLAQRVHVRYLLREARVDAADVDYLADVLLAPLSARLFVDQRVERGMTLEQIKAGYAKLVSAIVDR